MQFSKYLGIHIYDVRASHGSVNEECYILEGGGSRVVP
jgi:hypothetical protein